MRKNRIAVVVAAWSVWCAGYAPALTIYQQTFSTDTTNLLTTYGFALSGNALDASKYTASGGQALADYSAWQWWFGDGHLYTTPSGFTYDWSAPLTISGDVRSTANNGYQNLGVYAGASAGGLIIGHEIYYVSPTDFGGWLFFPGGRLNYWRNNATALSFGDTNMHSVSLQIRQNALDATAFDVLPQLDGLNQITDATTFNGFYGSSFTVSDGWIMGLSKATFLGSYSNSIQSVGYELGANGTIHLDNLTLSTIGNVTWSGSGGDNNWTTSANWNTPAITGEILHFGASSRTAPLNNLSAGTGFYRLTFDAKAPAYTISGNGIVLNNAVINSSTNAQTVNLPMQLSGAITMDTGDQPVTLGGNLSGTGGGLIKLGSGALVLAGTNTYTGATTISAGTLQIGNGGTSGTLSTSSAIVNNGTLQFNRTDTVTQGVDFNSLIAGSGGVIQSGSGTLVLNGTNTYTGPTAITGGTLVLTAMDNAANPNPLGQSAASATNLLLGHGTTLKYTGAAASTDRAFTLNGTAAGHGATLDASGTGAIQWTSTDSPGYGAADQARTLMLAGTNTDANTLAATLTDNGTGAVSLIKNGAGTWVLTSANTYSGGTTINSGTLQLSGGANRLNPGSDVTVADGILDLKNNSQAVGMLSGSGVVTNSVGSGSGMLTVASGAFSGPIGGAFGLTKTGAGTFVLSGANSYSGMTTVNEGELDLNTTGAQAIAGSLTVNGGVAKLLQADQINSSKNLIVNGGTFDVQSHDQSLANVVLITGSLAGSGGTLTSGNNFDLRSGTVSAILGGSVGLTKSTSGTVVLTGDNSFSGTTDVTGLLQLGNGGTSGSVAGDIWVNADGTLLFNRSGSYTTANMIGGFPGASIQVQGGGTNELTGDLTQFYGTLTASNATVKLNGDPGAPFGGLIVTEAGGTLGGTGALTSATMNPGSTLSPGNSPGTLTVWDTLVLNGNTNEFQLVSPSDYDQVVVYNQLTLTNNPILKLSFSAPFSPGSKFVLFQNGLLDKPANLFLDNPYYGGLHALTNGGEFFAISGGVTNNFALYYHATGTNPNGLGQDILLAAIPEPGTLSLLLLFGSTLFLRRMQRKEV